MTEREIFDVRKLDRYSKRQARAIKFLSSQLTTQRGATISENAVVRMLVDHSLQCPLFLQSISIDENISIDQPPPA